MQGAKQSSKSKSKSKKAACVPLELSRMQLYKECKKLIISSSTPHHHHHHHFMLSIPPSLPAKIPPPPPFPMGGHDNTKGHRKNAIICKAVAIGRGGVSGSLQKFLKVKQLEIGNADVVNLGARGHETGGCYALYQPFSSIKPGTRRAGLTGRFQNPLI